MVTYLISTASAPDIHTNIHCWVYVCSPEILPMQCRDCVWREKILTYITALGTCDCEIQGLLWLLQRSCPSYVQCYEWWHVMSFTKTKAIFHTKRCHQVLNQYEIKMMLRRFL